MFSFYTHCNAVPGRAELSYQYCTYQVDVMFAKMFVVVNMELYHIMYYNDAIYVTCVTCYLI